MENKRGSRVPLDRLRARSLQRVVGELYQKGRDRGITAFDALAAFDGFDALGIQRQPKRRYSSCAVTETLAWPPGS
jgi:hypothetical protein